MYNLLKKLKQKISLFLFGFYVICDNSNNTEETIKKGEIVIDLYFNTKNFNPLAIKNFKSYHYTLIPVDKNGEKLW